MIELFEAMTLVCVGAVIWEVAVKKLVKRFQNKD